MFNRLNIARTLVVLGLLTGLGSLAATFSHIGDPAFMVAPEFDGGPHHSWYHALREAFGDIGTILVVLLVMFAGPSMRTPATWWICLILLLAYYLPFWAGMPFMDELAAPDLGAELNHISQAVLTLAGIVYGRKAFYSNTSVTT